MGLGQLSEEEGKDTPSWRCECKGTEWVGGRAEVPL